MASKRTETTEECAVAEPSTSRASKKSGKKKNKSTNQENPPCDSAKWLEKYLKSQEDGGSDDTHGQKLGGHITRIIESLNVIVVKVISRDNLLFFGSPLFLHRSQVKNCETEYMFLGCIDDIFGSIGDPMYSVKIQCDLKNIVNLKAETYYFPDNPNTYALIVERTQSKHAFNKTKFRLKMRHM